MEPGLIVCGQLADPLTKFKPPVSEPMVGRLSVQEKGMTSHRKNPFSPLNDPDCIKKYHKSKKEPKFSKI
ncbi:hypothetical protein E2N92_00190 [Methanofollis formosanus]|uniref:Uncharacterized protein n=1 Tax=Methanofollis formosanus TaxID=299308 RepID=A0A8G1EF84_9EURY|nr:hypothetical protein [Methanofollis formosanus]QYZ77954.1 hypothetical protein E2N92_00190 [Methanofollis formosanus]